MTTQDTSPWSTTSRTCSPSFSSSGAPEDDELLRRPGHRDVAVDRSLDAGAELLRVDEHDHVELEPLRLLGQQRLDPGGRLEAGVADDAGDAGGVLGQPGVEGRPQVCDGPV